MKLVQKGNRQLKVSDDLLETFLSKGYVEVDEKTGKPIAKKATDELKALKKENAELKKANKELTEQLAALTGTAAQ